MTVFNVQYDRVRISRVLTLLVLDGILINAVALTALYTRFEFSIPALAESGFVEVYLRLAPFYTAAALVIFSLLRLYRSLWEYASIGELRNLMLAGILASGALMGICAVSGQYLPRSMPVINAVYLFLVIGGVRYAYRLARRIAKHPVEQRRRTMLIGAGAGGALVLRELRRSQLSQNNVVCIIDDDPLKQGSYLLGVKVVGGRDCIEAAAARYRVSDIILALPSAAPGQRRAIVEICQRTKCRIQTLPGLYQLASGQVRVEQLRNVDVEDLLGRDKVQVDLSGICSYVTG